MMGVKPALWQQWLRPWHSKSADNNNIKHYEPTSILTRLDDSVFRASGSNTHKLIQSLRAEKNIQPWNSAFLQ
jgi:aromatic ring-opening dioxygenase catalytic subunit (LigB family)